MSGSTTDFSMSTLSLDSTGSQNEDWDRSESDIQVDNLPSNNKQITTPRNSVVFPADGSEKTPGRGAASKSERTLSELLKLHAEKGTGGRFSADEASRVAEVLGQWVSNSIRVAWPLTLTARKLWSIYLGFLRFSRAKTPVN
jgi:hypothetical protein